MRFRRAYECSYQEKSVLKRIFLFVLTNLAVMLLLGVVFTVLRSFGVFGNLDASYVQLAIVSVVWGFAGSFISLLLSKPIAKWTTGAQVIKQPRTEIEQWLLATVTRQAQQVGIKTPEVAIYDSPEPNAFATGATRNGALVAVSTGLMRGMQRDEVEAVLAHEVSHAANGDMVTMALLQGVLNSFVFFFSRLIGNIIDKAVLRNERGRGIGYWVTVIVLEIALGILAMMILMWFSRWREFRADAGSAKLAGAPKMINALRRLGGAEESDLPQAVAAFGIRGGKAGFMNLFRSHPPIEDRIRALQAVR
jgi:heat shock protein HtpX